MDEGDYENWDLEDVNESLKELLFVTEPPVELLCPLCFQVLRDPFQTQCCGQYCCQGCLQKLFSRKEPCTLCQSQMRAFRDVNIARRVNALVVRCSYEARGCTWIGELGALGHHLLHCESRPVRCDVCGDTMLSNHLDVHKSTECWKRTFRCPHCDNFESTYEVVREEHWPTCSLYPIVCPNECSKGSIPRDKMLHHLERRCSMKRKGKEMAQSIDEMQEQLKERDLRIKKLENEIRQKIMGNEGKRKLETRPTRSVSCAQLQPTVKQVKSDNMQLAERVVAVQRECAELEHENTCLVKEVKAQEAKIQELETQNQNFRENVDRMSEELASHLKVMKLMNNKLRGEKQTLQKKVNTE